MFGKILKKQKIKSQDIKFNSNPSNLEFQPENSKFHKSENITFGNYVYIGENAEFWADGGITIGDNVIIAMGCRIHTSNHNWENAEYLPYDGISFLKPVTICDNVWIGGYVIIVPGVI